MRHKIFIIMLISFTQYVNGQNSTNTICKDKNPYKLSAISEVDLSIKGLRNPKISYDGKYLLLTKGMTGVYLTEMDNSNNLKTIPKEKVDGYAMQWSKDSHEIIFRRVQKESQGKASMKLHKYNIEKNTSKIIDISDLSATNKDLADLNNITLKYDLSKKKLMATDGTRTWVIAEEFGPCYNIVLSPDRQKVVFRSKGRTYVYYVDGSGMYSSLAKGDCSAWSPDGKYLLGHISTDDGHQYLSSDLYLFSIDGNKKWKLTDTKDKLEFDPDWSHGGGRIVYHGEKSGKIFTAKIINNE